MEEVISMKKAGRPATSWRFEEGELTVRHDGRTVALGRYATREWAAKAAAVYFAKRAGIISPSEAAKKR
jgi:hypothetical protein